MRFVRYILGVWLLVLASAVLADTSASDRLHRLLIGIHSMQADFTQTTTDGKGRVVLTSTGHLSLIRPGQFRWEVVSPNPQIIIANKTKLWVYDPDLQQVTIRAFSAAAGQTPASLLSDEHLTLSKDFKVTQHKETAQIAGMQSFTLLPLDADNLFESVKLTFIHEAITEMQFVDHLNHTTRIVFKGVKTNIALPASLFRFTPPENVDVIDETHH